jgi:hypothetical protein
MLIPNYKFYFILTNFNLPQTNCKLYVGYPIMYNIRLISILPICKKYRLIYNLFKTQISVHRVGFIIYINNLIINRMYLEVLYNSCIYVFNVLI